MKLKKPFLFLILSAPSTALSLATWAWLVGIAAKPEPDVLFGRFCFCVVGYLAAGILADMWGQW